jgi:hypothetical protein
MHGLAGCSKRSCAPQAQKKNGDALASPFFLCLLFSAEK